MVTQLRIYRIKKGKMNDWVREWREGVVPVRERFGYRIEGAWIVKDMNVFVWILAYDGVQTWEDREDEYYASAERVGLQPDPARFIADVQNWILTPVARAQG